MLENNGNVVDSSTELNWIQPFQIHEIFRQSSLYFGIIVSSLSRLNRQKPGGVPQFLWERGANNERDNT